jgi:hypothetical protein
MNDQYKIDHSENDINYDTMTQAEFEERLPEFFATQDGKVSEDPRLQTFLTAHPDAAALVRDLESIAEAAKGILNSTNDPSDDLWAKIQSRMGDEPEDTE